MPVITRHVPETNESVSRPVMFDIARQLLKITSLPENTTIIYPGDIDKVRQPGTSINNSDPSNLLPFNERILIEVEENYETDRLLSTAVLQNENYYIFNDNALDTFIKPVYSSSDVTINFKYRAKDKTGAIRWRDDIRTKVSMNRDINLHSVSYHYLIPPEFLYILKEIHRMREAVDGYGDTYDDYFKSKVTSQATIVSNLSGSQNAWGISQTQSRIVGWFDFEGIPELGSKEDDGDTWTITFSYKFKYDKPMACIMAYPLMIHNQLLDQAYRPSEPLYEITNQPLAYTGSACDFTYFEKGRTRPSPLGYCIPEFDEFIPSDIVIDTIRVVTALVSIDETNPKELMSLTELGDLELDPKIINFLKLEAPYLCNPYYSVFTLSLYRNSYLAEKDEIQIDNNLLVTSRDNLSLRNYYHVRLGLVANLELLHPDAIKRLREHGDVLHLILEALDPTLAANGLLPKILGSNYVTRDEMNNIIDYMNENIRSRGDRQIYQFNTLQVMYIKTMPGVR